MFDQNNTNIDRANVFSSGNVFSQSASTPSFGGTTAAPFGSLAPSTSVFTAETSTGLFDQPQTSQTSLCGSPTTQNVPFGTPATTGMDASFGGASTPLFGGASISNTNSNSLFNQRFSTQTAFGQPATTANAPVGTTVRLVPLNGTEVNTFIKPRYQCITAMKEYEDRSIEELRWEDYQANLTANIT